jgi:hypothetical protein
MDRLNARLGPAPPVGLTPGDAMAGLRRKGRGWAPRPVSWTPPCVARTSRARGVPDGMRAERCHRVRRGRTRAEADAEGGDRRCQARARCGGARGGLARRGTPLDPTRVARPGASVPAREAPALPSTHGEARAHRPAVMPAVGARLVAPAGGSPGVRPRGDGQTAALAMVQARPPA